MSNANHKYIKIYMSFKAFIKLIIKCSFKKVYLQTLVKTLKEDIFKQKILVETDP
jgi:hypothetical protein